MRVKQVIIFVCCVSVVAAPAASAPEAATQRDTPRFGRLEIAVVGGAGQRVLGSLADRFFGMTEWDGEIRFASPAGSTYAARLLGAGRAAQLVAKFGHFNQVQKAIVVAHAVAPVKRLPAYGIGISRVAVCANAGFKQKTASLEALRGYLTGDDPQGQATPPSVVFVQKSRLCLQMLRWRLLTFGKDKLQGYYKKFGARVEMVEGQDAVLERVRSTPSSVGFLLMGGERPEGVAVLSIARDQGGTPVAPRPVPTRQSDYPLQEMLYLYVRPEAPRIAREFGEFCTSEAGAEIAAEYGLITPFHQAQAEANLRLEQYEAGHGTHITAAGVRGGRELMDALAMEYVKDRAVIRMLYAPTDQTSAVGHFLATRDLLLTDQPLSDRTRDVHGAKWEQADPQRIPLGGRAVAIVVHSLNKLDSLTLDQIRAAYAGDVRDWKILAAGRAGGPCGFSSLPRGVRARRLTCSTRTSCRSASARP